MTWQKECQKNKLVIITRQVADTHNNDDDDTTMIMMMIIKFML